MRDLLPVGPDPHRRTGGVAVALELLLAVLEFGFLQLDEDVRRRGLVLVEDADVGALFLPAERHRVLDLHPGDGIAQVQAQNTQVELADRLLRRQLDGLAADQTGNVGRGCFAGVLEGDACLQRRDVLGLELIKSVSAVFQ